MIRQNLASMAIDYKVYTVYYKTKQDGRGRYWNLTRLDLRTKRLVRVRYSKAAFEEFVEQRKRGDKFAQECLDKALLSMYVVTDRVLACVTV